ncbi:MAG: enoyl-CoA hydratase/isomerase family protein [Chloroflexi bacterium]|nr:enoyl-CoA hydratase/isomerase family protein [Chloroflexota bacterium]
MPSHKYALIEKRDKVARVTINDPEKRNRLSREVILDLISAFEELREDDSVAVVITTGSGDKSWSAGQAGQVLLAAQDAVHQHKRVANLMFRLDELVRNFPKVTIAAVNGYCLGAAITFLISHDLAIASEENARFGLPEVIRGFPARTIVATLFRAVPMKWAFDMVLTGDNWDARTAQKAGLISRLVPHKDLQDRAWEWANEIARWEPITLEYSKKASHACMDVPAYVKSVELAALICEEHSMVNPRSHDGMRAFLGKTGIKADQTIKWV